MIGNRVLLTESCSLAIVKISVYNENYLLNKSNIDVNMLHYFLKDIHTNRLSLYSIIHRTYMNAHS